MEALRGTRLTKRYDIVTEEKAGGAVYTPRVLADFVSRQIAEAIEDTTTKHTLRILDPAIGHGELLLSLVERLYCRQEADIKVYGFETDPEALDTARERLKQKFPDIPLHFELDNFLEFVLQHVGPGSYGNLFRSAIPETYDIIIANPPYVRTQIMGAKQAQLLSDKFDLSGRVDLYHAFILGISQVLRPSGVAGIIVSNRFMTTKSGASVRHALFDRFNIRHAWDLGDTKLFQAAVLPAVLLVQGRNSHKIEPPAFTTIYETTEPASASAIDPISALNKEGVIEIDDGRHFHVQHGKLDTNGTPDGVWRIATEAGDAWLSAVKTHTWGTFRDIGKIRVGVKTCADKIFIRNDWQNITEIERPELLRPLTTHHIARRFKALSSDRPCHILYPHEVVEGRRKAVDLSHYPRSHRYLTAHRQVLEDRKYVIEAGRQWYEIWVPQDPNAWYQPKLIFRDIAEKPTFWIDLDGSIVNGDCYWLVAQNPDNLDLLWLAAAIANSTFIERFYDLRFQNKLYAGRRRFITQYVEEFPLPNPYSPISQSIIAKAKQAHEHIPDPRAELLQEELNTMVWKALTGSSPDPS